MGDPKGDHVVIQGVPQLQITIREDLALSAQKLALSLLSLFFTNDDLAKGICSPQSGGSASDKEVLDQRIVSGIRSERTAVHTDSCIITVPLQSMWTTSGELLTRGRGGERS